MSRSFSLYPPMHGGSSFLHTLILFHGLRGDSGRGFRAVTHLRVGGACADGAPSLAARHSCARANSDY